MIKLPKTVPIPAPDPATPTVAAPAPMNLAAASISRFGGDVWREDCWTNAVVVGRTGRTMVCGLNATRDAVRATTARFLEQLSMAIFVFLVTVYFP